MRAGRLLTAWLLIFTTLLSACSAGEKRAPLDPVTVQLKWVHQAQFAGFYAAEAHGFYEEQGIDVSLNPGGIDYPPERILQELVEGDTQFAIVGGDQLLLARSSGQPVVGVAVVFQKNPYVYVSLKDTGIKRPEDLVGKRVMVPDDAEVLHQALLRKLGIAPASVTRVSYERDTAPLLNGDVDAQLVYRTGLGLAFEQTEDELNWMWIEDYGIQFYADTIVTTEALTENDSDLIARFLAATMHGWRYAIEHPDEAVSLTLGHDATLDPARQARMTETQTPLVHTGEVPLGWMRPGVWHAMHDLLLDHGILARPLDLDQAYTTEFLPRAQREVD